MARASGVAYDMRKFRPYLIYNELDFKVPTYRDMESLIHHFKMIMPGEEHGLHPEVGEYYGSTEAPNGELGFFLVADGTSNPYRVRIRPPSFINYPVFPKLLEGSMLADLVAILASFNIIAGELDR
jgi:NADH-quinone oxidoreductase subunit D